VVTFSVGSSVPSWLWLAANPDCRHGIEELPVLSDVAISAKRHKVLERVIPLVASLDLVVDLQVIERSALLTSPSVVLQNPLRQAPASGGTSLPNPLSSVLSPTRPAPLPSLLCLVEVVPK
jgi:hypothetical protein